ncbi:TetR family transcriptional regulator [Nocardioides cynanchi]|uniref:TetR family transcriptional regulator n=1 Tax=Nocardioides cynanchi TaxID=2558918 RepID=UPI0012491E49|nr:TetR family transcriptional regulator [Nocardioides cynanchi]
MNDTRARLLAAAATAVREDGAAAASARSIAARAGVNQALVFYHFGTVSELVEAACGLAVDEAAGSYRRELDEVTSLTGLLDVGRALDRRERASGNVAMMAQLMSGAAHDPVLARAARYAMDVWAATLEPVLERLLADSPLAEIVDGPGLTRALSAAFIGLQLYEDVDPASTARALESLERLAVVVDVVNDLGPVTRRAVRSRLRSTRRASG